MQLKLDPPPRVAVVPLGTGNDLSLSFGWGNAFLPAWLRDFPSVYHMLRRVADAQPRELDCWRIAMTAGESNPVPAASVVGGQRQCRINNFTSKAPCQHGSEGNSLKSCAERVCIPAHPSASRTLERR